VSLKNRISSKSLNEQNMGVMCVAHVVRWRRFRCFGRLEHRGKDEWLSA